MVTTWQPAKKALSQAEAEELVRACRTVEEKFVILVMLTTGARRKEVTGLRANDLDLEARTIFIRDGKGGTSRTVPLAESLVPLVVALKYRNEDGYLIRGQRGGGITSESGFWYLFQRIAKRTSLGHIHPHCLRHTFAMILIKSGASLYAVKDLLGHRRVSTTELYLGGADMEMLREAAEKNPFAKK